MISNIPHFRKLREGDVISAREWNALVDVLTGITKSGMTAGIIDSTGFHPRRQVTSSGTQLKLFTVTGLTSEKGDNYVQAKPASHTYSAISGTDSFPAESGSSEVDVMIFPPFANSGYGKSHYLVGKPILAYWWKEQGMWVSLYQQPYPFSLVES